MERHNLGKERLIVPTEFTSVSRNIQKDLVPPSHFASSVQSTGAHRGVQIPGTAPPISWMNPGLTSVPSEDPSPTNPWLAITHAQQEVLELRKENQRIMMLQGDSTRGRMPVDYPSDLRARFAERSEQWSRWESEWHLEAEKHKAEAERLKGQVEALKETAERHREEMRDRDSTLNRQSHELEAMREELYKTKTELRQIKEELIHSSAQKEKISSQLEQLKGDSGEEITKLRRDIERSKEEARELALKADTSRLQAEEEAKQHILRLSEQLEEMHKRQEVELQQLTASHCAELGAARKTNGELQDRLQSMTSEVLQLKSTLMEVSTERDGLKEHLSQMGQAFETQSATLHSLRNYIGQLAPEKGEKERLNDAVERLNKEKAALEMTNELLTVRLNSVNEILTLQEEKMVKKTSTGPLVNNGSEGLQVLQLWREKVFRLCVQLRSKDIELRGEKEKLLSQVRSMEQQLQQEQHQASVLQHSLDDRVAELDLERVEKETLKQDLVQAHKENSQLKSQNQKAEAECKTLTEAVHRFSLAFKSKVAVVDAAQTRLNTLTQRLTFAKRRVETIQGLIMRRVALQKVHQASKQAEQAADNITKLQTELSLVCEERDKLTQELKRTPELIEKALADLKEQYEGKLRQQQRELEQSWMEVRQAVSGREEADKGLQQIQAQLEESKVNLEKLRSELLSQQEESERALQERVSEIKDRCAEKLREMEVQVNTAKREHTKAVMTLRQFEREAARKQGEMRETQHLGSKHTKREVQNKQLKETEKDKNLLLAVAERGLMSEYTTAHTTALQNSAAPREHWEKSSERSRSAGANVQLPAGERLLSVLEELHTLSAAVVNSSEDSAEEGQSDSVGPSTGSLHS
ncbi:coiled-coil alpha-helical rod protein 1 isoform X1 [Dicentrarchus labrax]|uniref:Coiled-coil alpha-helical rod protein 1 n=1 Tax=Dicentrarchus labrax TaxID=13489 RepID=A0A8C4IPL1_DICLA|nr:coiled-coil alpha-helical rod protein 1 isoform X1 [Dicentrarchus labrax]